MVYFSRVLQTVKCPVPRCPSVSHSVGKLRNNFMYCHFRYKVDVVQEGVEALTCCDLCVMYMPSGRLIKYQSTEGYDKNTHIWCQRRDGEIADKCSEATFRLTEEDEAECI